MKKAKTSAKITKARPRKKNAESKKSKGASGTQPALETNLGAVDIRKAHKNRLISAYFNRLH